MEIHEKEDVYNYWRKHGTKKTANYFGVPNSTIYYCVQKFNWTRPLANCTNILIAVARGESHPWDYPRMEFEIPDEPSCLQHNERIELHAYRL